MSTLLLQSINQPTTTQALLFLLPLVLLAAYGYFRFIRKVSRSATSARDLRRIRYATFSWLAFVAITAYVALAGQDRTVFNYELHDDTIPVTLLHLLEFITIVVSALLLDWMVESYLKASIDELTPESKTRTKEVSGVVRPVIYLVVIVFFVYLFQLDFFLWQRPATDTAPAINLKFSSVLVGLLALLSVRAGVWLLVRRMLPRYYNRNEVALGVRFAINRLLSYFIYLIALLLILENSGFDLVGLWTGAAALLVGIGIGLQQTFNDLLSGIILLFERSIEVGDMIEVDGMVGRVREISTRTSLIETRDNITIVVPNSKIVGEKAINWSHHDNKARFYVEVGVAYGSPTKKVRDILLEVAAQHPKVLKFPVTFTRFNDFGASSLDFRLYFFTQAFETVEDTKSDLRYEIDEAFRHHGVQIPFPQRDLWLRNPEQFATATTAT